MFLHVFGVLLWRIDCGTLSHTITQICQLPILFMIIGQISTGTTNGNGMNRAGRCADDFRRNSPLRTTLIDDNVTVLTFALHRSDIVALTDDGSLRRWRYSASQWQEVGHKKSVAGRESFRIRQNAGSGRRAFASAQLGYNDAIATSDESIYFGVGLNLQKLVSFGQLS